MGWRGWRETDVVDFREISFTERDFCAFLCVSYLLSRSLPRDKRWETNAASNEMQNTTVNEHTHIYPERLSHDYSFVANVCELTHSCNTETTFGSSFLSFPLCMKCESNRFLRKGRWQRRLFRPGLLQLHYSFSKYKLFFIYLPLYHPVVISFSAL